LNEEGEKSAHGTQKDLRKRTGARTTPDYVHSRDGLKRGSVPGGGIGTCWGEYKSNGLCGPVETDEKRGSATGSKKREAKGEYKQGAMTSTELWAGRSKTHLSRKSPGSELWIASEGGRSVSVSFALAGKGKKKAKKKQQHAMEETTAPDFVSGKD